MTSLSHQYFKQAQDHIPGGVNSPVRAFRGVGGEPVFISHAQDACLFDVDGKHYIDYVCSWGAIIAGHAHGEVIDAVQKAACDGLSFGAPTEAETRMAQKICELVPSVEQVRMVNSGTEAVMSALRLARGYTGRDKVIKFTGCYHGHVDALLVKAGSGVLTLGLPNSPGIPASVVEHTLSLEYNNLAQVADMFDKCGEQIACVIVEPVAGNMNCVPPVPGFLAGLRELCTRYGSLLIFDEVMTGFRVALGGAQTHYNVIPDMTTLGKVIGGGMPVAAFGAKREIMAHLAPLGNVYQAGTLSGNPVAMAAGLAVLKLISEPGFYDRLNEKTSHLVNGLVARANACGKPLTGVSLGGMFGIFFTEEKSVTNFDQACQCDIELFKRFFHGMLARGVYLAPSAFEAGFMSNAHSMQDIEKTLDIAEAVFSSL